MELGEYIRLIDPRSGDPKIGVVLNFDEKRVVVWLRHDDSYPLVIPRSRVIKREGAPDFKAHPVAPIPD